MPGWWSLDKGGDGKKNRFLYLDGRTDPARGFLYLGVSYIWVSVRRALGLLIFGRRLKIGKKLLIFGGCLYGRVAYIWGGGLIFGHQIKPHGSLVFGGLQPPFLPLHHFSWYHSRGVVQRQGAVPDPTPKAGGGRVGMIDDDDR